MKVSDACNGCKLFNACLNIDLLPPCASKLEESAPSASANSAIAELAEKFILSNKCDESVSIMLRCFAEYVRQQHQ